MTKLTTVLLSLTFCTAPLALAQSGVGGPIALNTVQMDGITAGLASAPTAAAEVLADASGRFAETGTQAGAWVVGVKPAGLPASSATFLTVTTASGNAVAQGEGAQSSVSTSSVNEQPYPDDSIVSTAVQHATTILGTTIAFQSQMKTGGNSVYFFNNPRAMFGRP